ncbi:MAG: twin-arginine translocation signal domain-containing protein, partial [Methylobacter sp.]
MVKYNSPSHLILPSLPRRRFLQGLAAGGFLLGMSPWLKPAWAQETNVTGTAKVLSGTEFDLMISETPVNFTGMPRMA